MPLTSTIADLTAQQLIGHYPVPAPLTAVLQQPSTDPTVFMNDPNYLKMLNEQAYWRYAVDTPNQWAANRYAFACKQWEMSTRVDGVTQPKSPILPLTPAYVVFDVPAFNQWWAQYQPNERSAGGTNEAPTLFFVKPAPLPEAPVILAPDALPPSPPAIDGPIGTAAENNPGVFLSAGEADKFPDGYVYAGMTGVYQKHIYSNPFTAGQTRVLWIQLQAFSFTLPPPVVAEPIAA